MIIKGNEIQQRFEKDWKKEDSELICSLIAIKSVLYLHGNSLKKVDKNTRKSVYKACSRKGVKPNDYR